jgi:hypothetical protein
MRGSPHCTTSRSPESLAAFVACDRAARRAEIYEHFCRCAAYGSTVDEVAAGRGLMPHMVSGRVLELREAGLILPLHGTDGRPVRRKTRSGCMARVYICSQFSSYSASQAELLFPGQPVAAQPYKDPEER